MKRKKNEEENEKTILYKQYQQQNNAEEPEEEDEEDNLEAEEKRKNLIVYGMMALLGLFIIFLLARNIYNKENTSVIYKNGGNSDRVIKTNVQQSEATVNDEQGIEEYIDDNTSGTEDLYDVDGNMSDIRDLYEIAVENGFVGTREEFYELLSNWNYSTDELKKNLEKLKGLIKQIENSSEDREDLEKELAELKKELTKEITNQIQTSGQKTNNTDVTAGTATAGRDGRDGTNGKDGKDGTNGKDGQNGATTYIAYADDMSGTGFSFTPTETSKYVGTCITSESSQPTNPAVYSNWQIYRTYVITTTTDENGVTTMHIN